MIKAIKKFIFRRRLKDFIKGTRVGTIAESDFIVVSRVEDFNPANDYVWDLEANKSQARDLHCHNCKFQVVMSNGAFAKYSENPQPEKIICARCLLLILKTEKNESR